MYVHVWLVCIQMCTPGNIMNIFCVRLHKQLGMCTHVHTYTHMHVITKSQL